MPVYVDRLYYHGFKLYGVNRASCHLFADSLEELYHFGDALGLKREWIHKSNMGIPHYDISNNKRKKAIEQGAIYLQKRHLLRKFKQLTKE